MPPLPPPDPKLPALGILLGDEAPAVLSAAIADAGLTVRHATPVQVRYSPGRSVIVQYRTSIAAPAATTGTATFVAAAGVSVPDGVPIVSASDLQIAVWRFPRDPFLPGLPSAVDPMRAADLLAALGGRDEVVAVTTRAYRATRRAVVEVRGRAATFYMKVLPPKRIAALQQRHVGLAPHLPVPRSLGWSRTQGVVAMQALAGRTLRRALEAGERELPSPRAIVSLLDRFPPPTTDTPPVAAAYQRAPQHAKLLRTVLPECAGRISPIVSAVTAAGSDEPVVTVHGDFHSSQVLTDSGRIVGLVDVDTAGRGQRMDDLANLVGQLATVALSAERREAFDEYIRLLLEDFDSRSEPATLRLRIAAVILGLATGPFRVQLDDWPAETLRRIDLAAAWVDSAAGEKIPITP